MKSWDAAAPWRRVDFVAMALGNAAGLFAVLAAYAGASHESSSSQQIGWLNLGAAGLIVVTAANAGWLLAGRRSCWRLRHALLPAVPHGEWPMGHFPGGQTMQAGLPVAAPAMTWYHSPSCRMVAGKAVAQATEVEHQAAGRRPCGLCLPAVSEARRP